MRDYLILFFLTLTVILLPLTPIVTLGYFLYLWGSIGLAVGTAAWNAFLTYTGLILTTGVSYIFAALLKGTK